MTEFIQICLFICCTGSIKTETTDNVHTLKIGSGTHIHTHNCIHTQNHRLQGIVIWMQHWGKCDQAEAP